MRDYDLAWQRTQYDAGGPASRGRCSSARRWALHHRELIWFEEYARAGAPSIGANFVGINHAGPTLIARASDGQRARPPAALLRGDRRVVPGLLPSPVRAGPGGAPDQRRDRRDELW